MNVMTVDDFHAKIEFDPDIDLFRGEILGLNRLLKYFQPVHASHPSSVNLIPIH